MGYNLVINGVYWGYNLLTNHLLSSWDIQVFRLVLLSRWFSFFQGGMCDRSLEVSDRSARTLFRWLVPHAWHHVLPALAVPCCHVKIPPAFPTSCIDGRRFIHKFPMCKCLAEQAVYVKPWLRFWNMFAKIFNIHKTNTLEGWCKHQLQKHLQISVDATHIICILCKPLAFFLDIERLQINSSALFDWMWKFQYAERTLVHVLFLVLLDSSLEASHPPWRIRIGRVAANPMNRTWEGVPAGASQCFLDVLNLAWMALKPILTHGHMSEIVTTYLWGSYFCRKLEICA